MFHGGGREHPDHAAGRDQRGRHEPRADDHGERDRRDDRRGSAHGDGVDRERPGELRRGAETCNYTGGAATASCTVTITSAVAGTTVVSATSGIPVNGADDDAHDRDGGEHCRRRERQREQGLGEREYPDHAGERDQRGGTNHMLTITVNASAAALRRGSATATASIVRRADGSFVGPNTCNYTGGAATATCTVTITSAAAGTTVVSATSDIPVKRPDDHAHDGHGGEHGRRRERQREQGLGEREHPDHAGDRDQRGRHEPRVDDHGQRAERDDRRGPHTATASIVSGPRELRRARTPATTPAGRRRRPARSRSPRRRRGRRWCRRPRTSRSKRPDDHAHDGTAVNTAAGGKRQREQGLGRTRIIQITPQNATNAVGTNHVLTITVNTVGGGTLDAGRPQRHRDREWTGELRRARTRATTPAERRRRPARSRSPRPRRG